MRASTRRAWSIKPPVRSVYQAPRNRVGSTLANSSVRAGTVCHQPRSRARHAVTGTSWVIHPEAGPEAAATPHRGAANNASTASCPAPLPVLRPLAAPESCGVHREAPAIGQRRGRRPQREAALHIAVAGTGAPRVSRRPRGSCRGRRTAARDRAKRHPRSSPRGTGRSRIRDQAMHRPVPARPPGRRRAALPRLVPRAGRTWNPQNTKGRRSLRPPNRCRRSRLSRGMPRWPPRGGV